ncbi:hypothetical protein D3C75_995250 [compost metagenome]
MPRLQLIFPRALCLEYPLRIVVAILAALRIFAGSQLLNNKVGAAEIAVFVQIIMEQRNRRILAPLIVRFLEEALQPELIVAPIPYYKIIPVQHLAVPVPKNLIVPSVLMVQDH